MALQQFVLNKEEIYKMKLMPNQVLIKIDNPTEYFKTKSGIYIYVDTEVPVARTSNRNGVVVSVCDHLKFTREYDWTSLNGKEYRTDREGVEYDTDIEIETEDRVWFSYHDGLNCIQYEQLEPEEVDGIQIHYQYKLLKYDSFRFVQKKDGTRKTLNGYVLVEPVIEKQSLIIDGVSTPSCIDVIITKKDINGDVINNFNRGTVKYMGTPNKAYKTPKNHDDFDFNVGNIIYFKNYNVEFEYGYLKQLKENLWTVRGCDVMAVEI
jgi:co-chaperonin GroES (HSP10)